MAIEREVTAESQTIDGENRTTIKVDGSCDWEVYCEALGIDPHNARQASLLGCLAARLKAQQDAIDAAFATLDHASQESTDEP